MTWRMFQMALFVTVAATSVYDPVWGTRLIGVSGIGYSLYAIKVQQIPYGIRGRPPSEYLRGWGAVGVGILVLFLSIVMVAAPTYGRL
jgi:hypothetical protein